jgi:Flp pilus assembly protein TadB
LHGPQGADRRANRLASSLWTRSCWSRRSTSASGSLSHFERRLYLATLLCTLLASILLIAPTIIHRLEFRQGEKAYVVQTANRLTIAGLSVFAVAMTSAVLLITHYLFGPATAIITTAIVAVAFAVPVRRRRLRRRRGR